MSAPLGVCGWLWLLWLGYWLLAARRSAPVEVPEPRLQRLRHLVLTAAVGVLLCDPSWARSWGAWLSGPARWAGVPLTAAGIAISVWARRHLGRYWSAEVVLKKDHRLVRTGPYRFARHPIYTGLLLAVPGTAVAGGRVSGLAACVLAAVVFGRKLRREEALLSSRFGAEYEAYRREVGALGPRPRS